MAKEAAPPGTPSDGPILEADWSAVGGGAARMAAGLAVAAAMLAWRTVRAVWDQAIMPALEKMIPLGASEVTHALFTGNPYAATGPTEMAVPIEKGGIHGPQAEPPGSGRSPAQEGFGYQVHGEGTPGLGRIEDMPRYEPNVSYEGMLEGSARDLPARGGEIEI